MRDWLIRRLGGYPELLDALDAIKAGDPKVRAEYIDYIGGFPDWEAALVHARTLGLGERHRVLSLAVKRLFNTVGPDDILKQIDPKRDQWMLAGKALPEAQLRLLRAEARQFTESHFWKMLQAELRYQGNRAIYTQSEDIADLVAGKMLVYYIDIVEKRLEKLLQ